MSASCLTAGSGFLCSSLTAAAAVLASEVAAALEGGWPGVVLPGAAAGCVLDAAPARASQCWRCRHAQQSAAQQYCCIEYNLATPARLLSLNGVAATEHSKVRQNIGMMHILGVHTALGTQGGQTDTLNHILSKGLCSKGMTQGPGHIAKPVASMPKKRPGFRHTWSGCGGCGCCEENSGPEGRQGFLQQPRAEARVSARLGEVIQHCACEGHLDSHACTQS